MDALIAYDRETGTRVWVHQFFPRDQNLESTHEETLLSNRDISGTPHLAFIDGRPVVLASQKHGPAWIVDLTDGSLVSGSRLLDQRPALIGSGGVADGVRVVSSAEPDRIAGFDLATGDLLWQQSIPGTMFAPVAIANGIVWVGSYGGHVHGFDLHSGLQLALLDAGGGVLGGASLADGTVFVGALQKPAGSINYGDSLAKLPGSVSAWRVG
jgi:outer membrane protein assembly factor BamB